MNSKFQIIESFFGSVQLITPFCSEDERGRFIKDYSQEFFKEQGIQHELKETFYTISHKGVIRAIHFQKVKEQAKLVRCLSGRIYDVVVDLRKDSPTLGQWKSFVLTGENQNEILVKVIDWTETFFCAGDIATVMDLQIEEFLREN